MARGGLQCLGMEQQNCIRRESRATKSENRNQSIFRELTIYRWCAHAEWFSNVGDEATISGSEQLISNKLAQKEYAVFFNFFLFF